MNTRSAIILALGLILAALVYGGMYQVTSTGTDRPFMWRINKFTGSVAVCLGVNCQSGYIAPNVYIPIPQK